MARPDVVTGQNEKPILSFKFLELAIPAKMSDEQAHVLARRVTEAAWGDGATGAGMLHRQPTATNPDRALLFVAVAKPIIDLRPDAQLSQAELESKQLVRDHYRGVVKHPAV